ncbi:hypothetical protein BST81_10730 [Leptolyngbya sp. 'hensonii']|uniref:serine/threonine-protein kinase n=1 Tax=Leptolyngbya sp. 'hensonii' TaxID=1922337 RepID=UPI00094F737A|nr:serine/threonine-protein kinase [Leptolyngbya sp. 'hensonii']OLP18428.1 hypothetical protein BST81_10730 [Leptolyngbya sp. 'hensonii']
MSNDSRPPALPKRLADGERSKTTQSGVGWERRLWSLRTLSHLLAGTWSLLAATAIALDSPLAQLLEYQVQTLFFEVRGPIAPPDNIVILAIDETSLQAYQSAPQQYSALEPLRAWPWKRTAYAQVIDRLMAAGVKAIGIDVVFSSPSSYGPDDDERLRQTLQRYGSRVALAATFEETEERRGEQMQLTYPDPQFRRPGVTIGSINYWIEADGRIHRLGDRFLSMMATYAPAEEVAVIEQMAATTPAFSRAILRAAQLRDPGATGSHIFFYGPAGTFEQIPFWHILDDENWNSYLKGGAYFKDKIVLIGATAETLRDFHAAPFAMNWLFPKAMSGVEIHANALATQMTGHAITEAVPPAIERGLLVWAGVTIVSLWIGRYRRVTSRILLTLSTTALWAILCYGLFLHGRLILPVAVPIVTIALSGLSYGVIGSMDEYYRKLRLRRTLRNYASFPIVQEIISQQEDLQDLLLERERAILNQKLGGRYRIIKVLGAGGFGETYVAEDTQRPGNPHCVVKLLRPVSHEPRVLQLARRLFEKEAEILERLGKHDQIPQLLAYFEEGQEFYLVQELIEGHPLSYELPLGRQMPEARVVSILWDLLKILEAVHSQGVIHRDIKPNNIIRRQADGKLVLIDFGAVKEIHTASQSQLEADDQQAQPQSTFLQRDDPLDSRTIGIGTRGYIPVEQYRGHPRFNSDIYAVGMTAVRALTGLPPDRLQEDFSTGQILWEKSTRVGQELATILDRMVHYDFTQRYQSVPEVLGDLQRLMESYDTSLVPLLLPEEDETKEETLPIENSSVPTEHWDSSGYSSSRQDV